MAIVAFTALFSIQNNTKASENKNALASDCNCDVDPVFPESFSCDANIPLPCGGQCMSQACLNAAMGTFNQSSSYIQTIYGAAADSAAATRSARLAECCVKPYGECKDCVAQADATYNSTIANLHTLFDAECQEIRRQLYNDLSLCCVPCP